jgi:hypothetical protein
MTARRYEFSRNEDATPNLSIEAETRRLFTQLREAEADGQTVWIDGETRHAAEHEVAEMARRYGVDNKIPYDAALTEICKRRPDLIYLSRLPLSSSRDGATVRTAG